MAGYKRRRAVRRRPRRLVRAKTTVDKRQQRQINKLLKHQYRLAQYKYSGSQLDAPSAAGTPVIVPNSWQTLFASNNRSNSTDRAFLQKIRFNFNVTVASSGLLTVNPMHYSIFLVSVRKEFVLQTYARTGPNLGTLTENYDYMTHTLRS